MLHRPVESAARSRHSIVSSVGGDMVVAIILNLH
jgi:hypothetical protein